MESRVSPASGEKDPAQLQVSVRRGEPPISADRRHGVRAKTDPPYKGLQGFESRPKKLRFNPFESVLAKVKQ